MRSRYQKILLAVLSSFVILVGLTEIIGWQFNTSLLKTGIPVTAAMLPMSLNGLFFQVVKITQGNLALAYSFGGTAMVVVFSWLVWSIARSLNHIAADLQRTNDRLSTTLENTTDGFVALDQHWQFIYVNRQAERLLGYPRSELLGQTLWQSVTDFNQTSLYEGLQQAIQQQKSADFEVFCQALNRWLSIHALPAEEGIVFYLQDISELKTAEATLALQASREHLIHEIAQRIRQSLSSEEIFSTTVTEVRQFLQAERVIIYQFQADGSGRVIEEAVQAGIAPLLGRTIHDPCFPTEYATKYQQGLSTAIADVYSSNTGNLSPCYIQMLTELQVRANLVVPILQGDLLWGLLIAHQCTAPREWNHWEVTLLEQLATQISIGIQQSQLYEQTRQQMLRSQTLNRVVQTIRSSLDLTTIFSAATAEIAHLLKVDQAEIIRYFAHENRWEAAATFGSDSTLGLVANRTASLAPESPVSRRLKQLQTVRLDGGNSAAIPSIAEAFPGAWLLVPLNVGSQVWGCLSLAKRQPFSCWQDSEENLAGAVADQLAIAIQQSELYQQVQQLNLRLERLVNERTTQLQEALNFEALLRRITDRVRDSLDEHQILQAAVRELTLLAFVDSCHAYLRNLQNQTATHYEFNDLNGSLNDSVPQLAEYPEVRQQILAGQSFQLSSLIPSGSGERVSLLVCPIIDNERVLGDLWLVKPEGCQFDQMEIRLVQQVANQCAIALRQSRLYEAAQRQVAELERLNRLKDDFLSTVSHELRTPMSSIKMATQMLQITLESIGYSSLSFASSQSMDAAHSLIEGKTGVALPKVSHYLQVLQDECHREISLINDLLDLSRLDAGTEPLTLGRIDLVTWITHISEPYAGRAQQQQQQLCLEFPEVLPEITTDLSSLARIVTELLTNACKYTPPQGTICVTAAVGDDRFYLQVRNSGIEIPAHELTNIFDKFYRIPNGDPWKHGGTGLGLALVKKLVEHIHGCIRAESANNTTTFTVELPLHLEVETVASSESV